MSHRSIRVLFQVLLWMCFSLLCSDRLWAGSMGQLFSFGDSGIDTGNILVTTGGSEPAHPYWEGRFSNGPNYLDVLARAVPGWDALPWFKGGTNAAFGGAQSGLGYAPLIDIPNVGQQVIESPAYYGRNFSPLDTVLFSMGQNDFLSNKDSPPDPAGVADMMIQSIAFAYDNGARRMIFPTLFPLHLMPDVANSPLISPAQARDWVSQVNAEADACIAQFRAAHPDAVVIRTDLTGRVGDIYANPEKYGLRNVTASAYTGDFYGQGGHLAADPDSFLWWDGAHVTARVQALIAKWVLLDIQNSLFPGQSSPQAGMGSILALLDQTLHRNQWEAGQVFPIPAPDRGTTSMDRAGDWDFTPFGVIGRQEGSGISGGWSWHHAGFSMGREFRASANTPVGFSLGYSRGKLDLDSGYGEADTRLYQAGLYGGLRQAPFFVSIGSRYGYADHRATRDLSLTGATARSRFHTHLFSGWTEAGVEIEKAPVMISPLIGLSYVRMVNGSAGETGGGLLGYDTLDYASTHHLRHKLGVRIKGTFPCDSGLRAGWSADGAWLHEHLDNRSESSVTHGGETYYFTSPSRTRDSLGLAAGVYFARGEAGAFSLNYQGEWSKDALTHAFNVSAVLTL